MDKASELHVFFYKYFSFQTNTDCVIIVIKHTWECSDLWERGNGRAPAGFEPILSNTKFTTISFCNV